MKTNKLLDQVALELPIFKTLNSAKSLLLNFKDFALRCRIRSGPKIIPFELYDYQLKIREIIDSHALTIIIKDRQLGLTELFGLIILHGMVTSRAYLAALVSINQQKSSDVSNRIKQMSLTLPINWERDADQKRIIKGGGQGNFVPCTNTAIRGLPSVIDLFFDEAGFIDNLLEYYGIGAAAQEMVPEDKRHCVLSSTVPEQGELSEFWGLFNSSNGEINPLDQISLARTGGTNCDIPGLVWWTDEDGTAKLIVSHKAHPIYSKYPDYIAHICKTKKIPRSLAEREHNLGIEQAQGSLFNASAAIASATLDGFLTAPQPGKYYAVTTDPNFGGDDQWVSQVWDITRSPYTLVAEYAKSNMSTDYSLAQLTKLIRIFRPCFQAFEGNSGGEVLANKILEIMRSDPTLPNVPTECITTSHTSKKVNTDAIALALEFNEIRYPKKWDGISEMRTFSLRDRKATGSAYDDRITAWAALWAFKSLWERLAKPSSTFSRAKWG